MNKKCTCYQALTFEHGACMPHKMKCFSLSILYVTTKNVHVRRSNHCHEKKVRTNESTSWLQNLPNLDHRGLHPVQNPQTNHHPKAPPNLSRPSVSKPKANASLEQPK